MNQGFRSILFFTCFSFFAMFLLVAIATRDLQGTIIIILMFVMGFISGWAIDGR